MDPLSRISKTHSKSIKLSDLEEQLANESTRVETVLTPRGSMQGPTSSEPVLLASPHPRKKRSRTVENRKRAVSEHPLTQDIPPDRIDNKFDDFDTDLIIIQSSADRIVERISTLVYQLRLEKEKNVEIEAQRDEWMKIAKSIVGETEITRGAEIETPIVIPSWPFAITFFVLGLCVCFAMMY